MKLIQFKADWCNPCKLQSKEFSDHPVSIELEAINIDEDEQELAAKFGVKSIPTMILIDNNEVVHRWTGYTQSSTINEFIDHNKNSNN